MILRSGKILKNPYKQITAYGYKWKYANENNIEQLL